MVNATKRKFDDKKPSSSKKQQVEPKKAEKKRSRPVTAAPITSASNSDSEAEFDDAEEGEEGGEWSDVDEDVEMGDEQPSEKPLQPKNPNAAKESHQAQKVLQQERKAAKPHSDLLVEAKKIWSLVRQKNIAPAERQKHVKALMKVIRGKVKDIVFKHDASRIVQSIVKYGGQPERDEIALELQGKFRELAQNKYSKVIPGYELIRLSSAHRQSILLELQPQVMKLLLHREATAVLADAFELYANAYERSILLREFYGKEATLFTGLAGFLEGVDVERRRRVLVALKENLTTVFNNPDKGAITHAIVHRALWEYLAALLDLPDEAEQEKLRREIFEIAQDVLAEMVHTRDGSRVVREFLAYGTAKDRKQILKVLKPHVERMCLDDEAQNVLFTALDVTDDTKLLAKTLVAEIVHVAPKLYTTVQGRRALLYLIMPRSRRHFTPAQIASLAETDAVREKTSKKSAESREAEIRKAASEGLISWVEESGKTLIRDPGASLVVADIVLYADGDKSGAISTLLTAISSPYPSLDKTTPHPIDLAHSSRLYKTLLQGGHFSRKTESIEPVQDWDATSFAVNFATLLSADVITSFCVKGDRNGTFVVAELCEALVKGSESSEEAKEAREKVKGSFKRVKKDIEGGEARGKNILLEKLAAL
ncbi:armadillo-type protein [Ephemerocybe angulata]|uniref:Armadillo-type protein n=1 Tax=Ephemerocybe angulata TaxID=980116 RepID=A0A8H6M5E2_9AGAR|nr:armadillo-type protein [Tulosesus angulatus]